MKTTAPFLPAFCLLAFPLSVSAQNVVESCSWLSGAGDWENALNWSCGLVPNNVAGTNFNVAIGDVVANLDGVRLSSGEAIFHLTVVHGSTLYLTNGAGLFIQNFPDAITGYPEQELAIGGQLVFQNASNSSAALQLSRGDMTLREFGGFAGTIRLSNGGSTLAGLTGGLDFDTRLLLRDGATVRGAGQMNDFALNLYPLGQVLADGGALHWSPNTSLFMSTNQGLMQSSVGATLILDAGGGNVYTNIPTLYNSDGVVGAQGTTMLQNGFRIVGGLLQGYGGGRFRGGGELQDLTLGFASEFDVVARHGWMGGITNHGLFSVSGGNAIVMDSAVVRLAGQGTVNLSTNGTGTISLFNHALLNLDNLIDGEGQVTSAGANDILDNEGRIEADVLGQGLFLFAPANAVWTNSGTLGATNGATLFIGSALTLNNTNGLIDAQMASTNRLANVKVFGGTVSAAGTNGVVRLETSELYNLVTTSTNAGAVQVAEVGSSKVAQILNLGDIEILNGGLLNLVGDVTNHGRIFMQPNVNNLTELYLPGTQVTISGTGSIEMSSLNHNLTGSGGSSRLVNAGNTIRGTGRIQNILFDNQGLVEANAATAIVINETGFMPWTNHGTLHAAGAGGLEVQEPKFSNQGTVQVDAASQFYVSFGDTYEQTAGLTTINGSLLTQTPNGGVSLLGGFLAGSGTINDHLTNSGAVVFPGAPLGILTITRSYLQQANGTLQIALGGTVPGAGYSQLLVGSSATLSGALNVTFTNGFLPAAGNTFEILKCASRSGTFANGAFPAGNGVTLLPRYTTTNVTLVTVATALLVQPLLNANGFLFSFQSVNGVSYQAEYTDSLSPPIQWHDLGAPIAGDGGIATVTNSPVLPSQRFYRVRFQ